MFLDPLIKNLIYIGLKNEKTKLDNFDASELLKVFISCSFIKLDQLAFIHVLFNLMVNKL